MVMEYVDRNEGRLYAGRYLEYMFLSWTTVAQYLPSGSSYCAPRHAIVSIYLSMAPGGRRREKREGENKNEGREKSEILPEIIQLQTKTHLGTMRSVRVYMPGM
jgi:hypothetical protein